jgi:hypothetical protein
MVDCIGPRTPMSENPVDLVWLIAGAALAALFGLAGPVLAVYAVRRRYPVFGAVFGVLASSCSASWPSRPGSPLDRPLAS